MFHLNLFSLAVIVTFITLCSASILHTVSTSPNNGTSNSLTANDLVNKALAALGGEDALRKIEGITYHAPR